MNGAVGHDAGPRLALPNAQMAFLLPAAMLAWVFVLETTWKRSGYWFDQLRLQEQIGAGSRCRGGFA